MFCPKCGKQFPDGAKFCPKCGNTVTKSISSSLPTPPASSDASGDNLFRKKSSSTYNAPHGIPGVKEVNYRQYIGILLAVIAGFLIVGAAFFYLKPKLFPEKPPPRVDNNVDLTQEMIDHPERFVDYYDDKKKPDSREAKAAKVDAAKEVKELADELVGALEHDNYTKFYTAMTPKLHRWIENYYTNVKDSGMYADMRRLAELEPVTGDYTLDGKIMVKGPRAEVKVSAIGPVQGSDVEVEYIFIFVNEDGVWRLDGIPGGPGGEGPIVKNRKIDFDGDGEKESVVFYGDITHRVMRWEVISAAGEQKYVFELPACGTGSEDPLAEAGAQDVVRAVAAKQITLRAMGEAEAKAITGTFPNLNGTMQLQQALAAKRSGFIMQDGCGGNGFFVFQLKGSYMEVQAPPPPKEPPAAAAATDEKPAKPKKPKRPASR